MERASNPTYSYLVTVAYDGSDFWGWATQPDKVTVQGYIEKILGLVFQQKISLLAASRTDKGVHSLDQKFTFRLGHFFSPTKLLYLLRRTLRQQVLIKRVQKVDNDFHPIRNVVSKEYRYFINIGQPNTFQKKYRWEYNWPLATRKLNRILTIFRGKHNFFNYAYCRWKDKDKINTERKITSLKSWKEQDLVIISVIGKSFLRYQIRALIGEVINCYEAKQTINNLKEKLINFQKKNYKYKNLAPASGLYLWKIKYPL